MSVGSERVDQDLEKEVERALAGISADDLMDIAGQAPAPPQGAEGKVAGRIIGVRGTDVFVDLGGKAEGVLTLDEFPPDSPPEPGKEMTFFSRGVDVDSGLTRLSLSEVILDATWESLKAGDVVEGRVTGVNKGGLEVAVGPIRAFMPAGHVDFARIDDFTPFINQKLECEIIEVDRLGRNLTLSRRRLLERQRAAAREQLRYTLQAGQVRKGVVRRLMDYGAFVDLGGLDGLLHVSDMSYGRVKHPSEILKVGDQVEVTVLKIDLVKDKISLGLKQLQTDPWTLVPANYHVGNTVEGRVTKLMDFGAFVEIEPGVEALIPISELSYTKRIHHPRELLKEGDPVQAVITSMEPEKHRMSLSLKRLGADPWTTVGERYRADEVLSGMVTRTVDFGAFVQLEEGVEGMVHISELSHKRVRAVTDVVKPGQVVSVRVLGVDPEKKRISLSIKATAPKPEEPVAAGAADSGGQAGGRQTGDQRGRGERPDRPAAPSRFDDGKPGKRKKPLRGGLD